MKDYTPKRTQFCPFPQILLLIGPSLLPLASFFVAPIWCLCVDSLSEFITAKPVLVNLWIKPQNLSKNLLTTKFFSIVPQINKPSHSALFQKAREKLCFKVKIRNIWKKNNESLINWLNRLQQLVYFEFWLEMTVTWK